MKTKILIILIIIVGIGIGFYLQQKSKISEEISLEVQLKNLGAIILQNTKFEDFSINRLSLKYPDWSKIEIDPFLVWPKEIAEKVKILLYLNNPNGVTILVTKRELSLEDLVKPYPLILREADRGYIYSVGISAGEEIFEDYQQVADYIIDSVQHY